MVRLSSWTVINAVLNLNGLKWLRQAGGVAGLLV